MYAAKPAFSVGIGDWSSGLNACSACTLISKAISPGLFCLLITTLNTLTIGHAQAIVLGVLFVIVHLLFTQKPGKKGGSGGGHSNDDFHFTVEESETLGAILLSNG